MKRRVALGIGALTLCPWLFVLGQEVHSQPFGIELHNTLMPAAGGMAGASVARPQDNLSAINGNPATLVHFSGTQFSFGGAWAEGTYNITQLDPLPLVGVDPYSAKSNTPGTAVPNIGVTHDLSFMGLPAVWGIGLFTNAGAGTDFRRIPEANGTNCYYLALDFTSGVGVLLTEQLSVGASMTVGSSYIDGPFVDVGGMTNAYGIRGTLGATYDLGMNTTAGVYWQTEKHFQFEDAVEFRNGDVFDLEFDHPENIGIGIANSSLMGGRLLVAMDVLFKNYSDADFLGQIYDDQWVYQFGLQYELNPCTRVRLGYAYNENPMAGAQRTSIGGVPLPDGVPALRYIQGQFAAVSQHRITGGVGLSDLLPGVDLDFFAGGMFEESDQFASTIASVESYWIGSYLTWRFGSGR
jgi:long-chain fatty acid transport protein